MQKTLFGVIPPFKHTVSQSPVSLLAAGNLPLNPPRCHTLQSYRQ